MIYRTFMLLCLSCTYSYKINGRGPIPLNKDNALKFVNEIVERVNVGGGGHQAKESRPISSILSDIGVNILKIATDDTSHSQSPNHYSNRPTRTNELHYLAEDFITILTKFEHRALEEAWNSRPDMNAFTEEDLLGSPKNKRKFLEHLKSVGDIYKYLIDYCDGIKFKDNERTLPDYLIVTDFIAMANSFNVTITKNRGVPFDVYMNEDIMDGSITADDLVGTEEDKRVFLHTMTLFSGDDFRQAFDKLSYSIHGLPVADHIMAEWVIATARNHDIVIISHKGKPFNMNWKRNKNSFVGYPSRSYGAMDYFTDKLLNQ